MPGVKHRGLRLHAARFAQDDVLVLRDERSARGPGSVASSAPGELADAGGLVGGEDGELDALLGEEVEDGAGDGGLGEPHAFGRRPKRCSKSAMPQRIWVRASRSEASGMMMWL